MWRTAQARLGRFASNLRSILSAPPTVVVAAVLAAIIAVTWPGATTPTHGGNQPSPGPAVPSPSPATSSPVVPALSRAEAEAAARGIAAEGSSITSGGGRPVEEGARVVARIASIGTDGPTGTFQEDAGELAW